LLLKTRASQKITYLLKTGYNDFMPIILAIVLIALAIGFFLWMVKYCLLKACPTCQEDSDQDEMVIPIVPGFIWWCPTCNETCRQNALVDRKKKIDSLVD
jgi:hypothetical protein